jgi:hypothetical protein
MRCGWVRHLMAERHSEYERDEHDWYVEPVWAVHRLAERVTFEGAIHDPCCGIGTIPLALIDAFGGLLHADRASGADLVDRDGGTWPVQDFLTDYAPRDNIVSNPPFKIGNLIAEHALKIVQPGGVVALVCNAKFLFSQARHPLFNRPEMERVIVFSRRPSMPPGEMLARLGEGCRGGGSIDFVWCVWRVGKTERGCTVDWTL